MNENNGTFLQWSGVHWQKQHIKSTALSSYGARTDNFQTEDNDATERHYLYWLAQMNRISKLNGNMPMYNCSL